MENEQGPILKDMARRGNGKMFLDGFSFEKLINPYTPAEFFRGYFEQQPLLIKRNDPGYYHGLLNPADLDQILFYWPNSLSTVNAKEGKGSRMSMGSKATQRNLQSILKGFSEGHSIILDSLDNRHPPLTKLCALLEMEHTWPYQTNIYITPPGSQGFKTHADNHSVFILQTTGRKSWRVNKSITAYADRTKEQKHEIDADNHLAFILEEGDLLYIPKHFEHDAVSDEASSVHITLGMHPPSWFGAVSFVLNQSIYSLPALENSLPPGYVEQPPEKLGKELELWMGELAKLDFTAIAKAFIDRRKDDFRGLFFGALEQRLLPIPVNLETNYIVNQALKMKIETFGETCQIMTPHKPVELPALFAEQIKYCLSGHTIKGSQIPGMDPTEQTVLLQRLLAEGLLVRSDCEAESDLSGSDNGPDEVLR